MMRRGPERRRPQPAVTDAVAPTPWLPALLLGALGGLGAVAAFPPYDHWWLLPVGVGMLSLAVLTRRAVTAVLASLAWGLGFFVPLTEWANTYAGTMPWLALAVFESLYIVLYGLLVRTVLVRRGPGAGSALVVSGLWVGAETLRGTLPWGGLSWGSSGFALAESPLLNLGPWIGMAGLAFVVALLGQLLMMGTLCLAGRRETVLGRLGGVWPIALALALVLATLVAPLPQNRAPEDRSTVAIAAVQGSMDPIDPVSLLMPPERFDNSVAETRAVIERSRKEDRPIDLVLWPEDSTGRDPRQNALEGGMLSSLSTAAEAPILVGTQTPVGEENRYNTSLMWGPDGATGYEYHKRHPVPFGEYVPYRDFFRTFSPLVDLIGRDMLPGQEVGVVDLADQGGGEARVGILICFEIAYEDLVQDVVHDGAEVIVVQSNNALFGDSHEAIQQLAEAKVFAVISGRSVVHLSTVGHSAVYSPEGRELAFLGHWERGAMLEDVPLRTSITPAIAAGPWIAVGLIALGLLGVLGSLSGSGRVVARPRDLRRARESGRR